MGQASTVYNVGNVSTFGLKPLYPDVWRRKKRAQSRKRRPTDENLKDFPFVHVDRQTATKKLQKEGPNKKVAGKVRQFYFFFLASNASPFLSVPHIPLQPEQPTQASPPPGGLPPQPSVLSVLLSRPSVYPSAVVREAVRPRRTPVAPRRRRRRRSPTRLISCRL